LVNCPGERLMVCRNPELARLRAKKREDLLKAPERDLAPIAEAVRRARRPLRGKTAIALKVGAVLNKHKVAKHFETTIEDDRFDFRRKEKAIAEETALDGISVVRTNLPAAALDDAEAVAAYKRLGGVERAFRSLKTVDLEVRPIFHWASPRVKAHVLLCMLAYYVERHMRARLAPLIYDDDDREAAARLRTSVVDALASLEQTLSMNSNTVNVATPNATGSPEGPNGPRKVLGSAMGSEENRIKEHLFVPVGTRQRRMDAKAAFRKPSSSDVRRMPPQTTANIPVLAIF